VVARQALGRGASVALVRGAGKALLVGVTEHAVTVLAEAGPEAEAAGDESQQAGAQRMGLVETLRERTARRS
jgi:flagellar biogenesis protein FliO